MPFSHYYLVFPFFCQATCTSTGPGTVSCQCIRGWTGDGKACVVIDNCVTETRGGCHINADCNYIGPGQVQYCYSMLSCLYDSIRYLKWLQAIEFNIFNLYWIALNGTIKVRIYNSLKKPCLFPGSHDCPLLHNSRKRLFWSNSPKGLLTATTNVEVQVTL